MSTPSELREAARAVRQRANTMLREAEQMEREAHVKELPVVVFETEVDSVLKLTQAQLHFIHTKAFGTEGISSVNVQRDRGCIIVQYGDERDFIDDVANVVKHEGFDPFDNDWKAL